MLARFREEGESAKTADRTELQKLLQFCRTNKGRVQFVVVFNLTRFAREKYDHFALRAHLKSLGISLRSATEPIDDTSTGKLMEGVLAAFAQFDNDVRSDRTRGRHAGRTGARTLDVSRAPRLPERAPVDGQEPDSRSGTRAAGATSLPGFRDGTVHEARGPQERQRPRPDDATRQAGPVADVRRHAAEPRLHRRRSTCLDFGISSRGDFEPLITEKIFFRVQAILDGRYEVTAPQAAQRSGLPAARLRPLRDVRQAADRRAGRRAAATTTPTTTAAGVAAP